MSHFSIGKLLSRSLFSKPATRLYPFQKRETYSATRGHIAIAIDQCTFCTLCQKKCPTYAIKVARTEKTWEINRLGCIQCGACVDVCPKKCLTMENTYSPASVAKTTDVFRLETPAVASDGDAAKA